ncbi:hypothetical protein HOG98_03415 [bacterium]|jgi:hypothetical protein|nr:hypothetical protein [bacterium]
MGISNNDKNEDTSTKETKYVSQKKEKVKNFSILTNQAYQDACKKEFDRSDETKRRKYNSITSLDNHLNSKNSSNKYNKIPSKYSDSSSFIKRLNLSGKKPELNNFENKDKNELKKEKGITDLSCTVFEKSLSIQNSLIRPALFIEDGLEPIGTDTKPKKKNLQSSEPIPPDFKVFTPNKRIDIQSLLCAEKITAFDISKHIYIRIGISKYIAIKDFINHSDLLSITSSDKFREMYLRDCQNGRLHFSKEIYDGYHTYGSIEKPILKQYSKKLYSQINCLMRNDIQKYFRRNQISKNGHRVENSRKVLSKLIVSSLKHTVMMAHCLNSHSEDIVQERTLYRGDNISDNLFYSYSKGNEVLEGSFLATSTSLSSAAGFIHSYNTCDNPVLFIIESKSAIQSSSFSSFSSDKEFIVRPGSRFLVTNTKKSYTAMHQQFFTISLKEI